MKDVDAKKRIAQQAATVMTVAMCYASQGQAVPADLTKNGWLSKPMWQLYQYQGLAVPPWAMPKPIKAPDVAPPPEPETPAQAAMLKKMKTAVQRSVMAMFTAQQAKSPLPEARASSPQPAKASASPPQGDPTANGGASQSTYVHI